MNSLQLLQDERKGLARVMRNLNDQVGSRAWTVGERATWDSCLCRLESLDTQIGAQARKEESDQLARLGVAVRDAAFEAWMRGGEAALSAEQRSAIRNTMSTTTPGQGGYTVPASVGPEWQSSLKAASAVRQVARVIPGARGVLSWPTSDLGSEVGERLAQNAAAGSLDPSFGTAVLNSAKYSSLVVTVPIELLQDSAIDLVGYLLERLSARIARASNPDFTAGTGSSQPTGFVTGAGVGKTGTTGQTATIIYDDIVDLIGSVNAAYRTTQRQGLAFMMSDAAWKVVRKIRDTTNARPLFLPGDSTSGETLMGYQVVINDDMAVMAANAKSVAFGNWAHGYVIADAMDVQLIRMDDSAYMTKGQVGFLALARAGGAVVDAAAIKLYVNSAT